jgi:(p)ppGpp synthase/HD superfamily hydrolase
MDTEALLEHLYRGKKRKTGDPAVSHLFEVKKILEDEGITEETILNAALLHDVLEDININKEYISYKFGDRVLKLVELMSKETIWHTSFCRAKSNLDEMEMVIKDYPETIIIKMADRLHNLETIRGFKIEKQKEYLNETKTLLIPLFECALKRSNFVNYKKVIKSLLEKINKEIKIIENRLN